jgi:phosphatidylglycerophosphate synthase
MRDGGEKSADRALICAAGLPFVALRTPLARSHATLPLALRGEERHRPLSEGPVAEIDNRRPIKSREAGWAHRAAAALADADADPNLISAASFAFAALGAAMLLGAGMLEIVALRAVLLIGAAACIQLRLVCNLLDGMVAVEHGRGSPAGAIWNELPDRFSDVVLLAAAGYCAAGGGVMLAVETGGLCAALALLTAYIRELGRGLGFAADFSGPMAKPQRMAALTIACAVGALEPLWGWRGQTLMIALIVIALGTALTAYRRTRTLARRLAEKNPEGGNP